MPLTELCKAVTFWSGMFDQEYKNEICTSRFTGFTHIY